MIWALRLPRVGTSCWCICLTGDSDGFDVISDDRKRLVTGNSSRGLHAGGDSGRKIQNSFLPRPRPKQADSLGCRFSEAQRAEVEGRLNDGNGPVGETVDVTYSYTDMVVLSALWSNIVERRDAERLRCHACVVNSPRQIQDQ